MNIGSVFFKKDWNVFLRLLRVFPDKGKKEVD
jgi:hypothetical protein